jgi:hypothetical protein
MKVTPKQSVQLVYRRADVTRQKVTFVSTYTPHIHTRKHTHTYNTTGAKRYGTHKHTSMIHTVHQQYLGQEKSYRSDL